MPDNVSTKLAGMLMRQGVDLARVEAGLIRKLSKLYDQLTKDLMHQIVDFDPTTPTRQVYRAARLTKLLGASDSIIKRVYEQLSRATERELAELAEYQQEVTIAVIHKSLSVELNMNRMTTEMLETMLSETMVQGAPNKEWWKTQSKSLQRRFANEIRQGMFLNETNEQILRRVRGTRERRFMDGLVGIERNKAKALVRTAVQTVANEARWKTYQNNTHIIKGTQWLSTLDTRTSDICKSLDGQAWYLDGRKMEGTVLEFTRPPAHWQCRSTLVPITKSWQELATNKKLAKQLKDVPTGTRASMNGQVSKDMNYESWLKTQDKKTQLDVLGPTKYNLWHSGKLSFTDLVDQSHNPRTVAQLKELVS